MVWILYPYGPPMAPLWTLYGPSTDPLWTPRQFRDGLITHAKDGKTFYLSVKGRCCELPDCELGRFQPGSLACMVEVHRGFIRGP